MSLFKKIFNKNKSLVQPEASKPLTALILLFDILPKMDVEYIANAISKIEHLNQSVKIDIQVVEKDVLYASIEFDNHNMRLVGFSSPVPSSTLEHTIPVSNWQKEDKLPLQNHKAHIICYYDGGNSNPSEQLIALYKVAYAFYDKGFIGVLDEDSWNCMPKWMVKEQMKPEMLQSCRKSMPLGIWTGFIKFFKAKDEVWFCTKGYHRYGVQDLAYFGRLSDADDAFNIFENLFFYMCDGAILKAGETAQISENVYLRFQKVYEYQDYLNSPLETIVFEKIKASEINRKI